MKHIKNAAFVVIKQLVKLFKGGLCAATHSRPLHAFSMCKVASRQYIFRFNHLTDSFDPGIKLKVITRATSATIPHPSILDRLKNIDQNVIFGNFFGHLDSSHSKTIYFRELS